MKKKNGVITIECEKNRPRFSQKEYEKLLKEEEKMKKQTKSRKDPAMTRAMEMMQTPMKDLPKIAVEYAQVVCNEIGACGEVFLTCWAAYAQCVEGLECYDDLYIATDQAKKWFEEHMEQKQTQSKIRIYHEDDAAGVVSKVAGALKKFGVKVKFGKSRCVDDDIWQEYILEKKE